jgi:hypothetical protein
MPLYGFKLLNILIENNDNHVLVLKKLKYLTLIIDYYTIEKLNTNVLKLINKIVENKDI